MNPQRQTGGCRGLVRVMGHGGDCSMGVGVYFGDQNALERDRGGGYRTLWLH